MVETAQCTHTVRGFCALCTAHCATVATVTDGKVVRLEADPRIIRTEGCSVSRARLHPSWFITPIGQHTNATQTAARSRLFTRPSAISMSRAAM